jgi:environmental stress-induced protein Ves
VAVILRAAQRSAVAWKNGGGLTHEVAVHPPGSDLDSFDWRVSLAEVRQGGPFSVFPGVDRHLALISGRLELSIAGRDALTLAPDSLPLVFAGDVPASAAPVQAPVRDLNVMTRRGRCQARLTRHSVAGATTAKLEAPITLIVALAPLRLRTPHNTADLAALDAARFAADRHTAVTLSSEGDGLEFWLIELLPA